MYVQKYASTKYNHVNSIIQRERFDHVTEDGRLVPKYPLGKAVSDDTRSGPELAPLPTGERVITGIASSSSLLTPTLIMKRSDDAQSGYDSAWSTVDGGAGHSSDAPANTPCGVGGAGGCIGPPMPAANERPPMTLSVSLLDLLAGRAVIAMLLMADWSRL